MHAILKAAGFGVACAMAMTAGAQTSQQFYRWTDAAGVVHYGDAPPDHASASLVKVDGRRTAPSPPATAATLPAMATSDAALAQAEQNARTRNCSKARANQATLHGGLMIVDGADLHTAHRMSAQDQAAAKQKADSDVAQYCGGEHP